MEILKIVIVLLDNAKFDKLSLMLSN